MEKSVQDKCLYPEDNEWQYDRTGIGVSKPKCKKQW